MSTNLTMRELCDIVRQTSYEIHVYHGHGMFEKIYENALTHRLKKVGIDVIQQHPLQVYDEDGEPLGDYVIDLCLDGRLIVELKATRILNSNHQTQILGYLRAMRIKHGLLINFGSARFEMEKFIV